MFALNVTRSLSLAQEAREYTRGILCPVKDLSFHFVAAVGREFAFYPIDYSTKKHWELMSTPEEIELYSMTLVQQIAARSTQDISKNIKSSIIVFLLYIA